MEYVMDYNLLQYTVAGNSINRYLAFILLAAGSILFLKLFNTIIFSRIKKFTKSTDSKTDDTVILFFQKNLIPVIYILAVYSCTAVLYLGSGADKRLNYIFAILIVFFITRFSVSLIIFFIDIFWLSKDDSKGSSITVLINMVIRIIVWTLALLILLDNAGIKISGLIAGLGVGGVAIAFASQSILRDIFNYFTIFFDRPFEIGDFLVIDKFAGVVEHIGIKTTRLRSLGGEQLIFSNTDLTGSRVRNYKSMQERRVVFSFGVTYQTPIPKLKKISEEIKKIIESIDTARFDRAHFQKFGDSSLDFEVVYYVLSGDYSTYMDLQQEINIEIMHLLKKMKVEFAYPTRTIFMQH
jgi:small-conductance mechanosensitive channel